MIYLELGDKKRVCINVEFSRNWLFSRSAIPQIVRPASGESGSMYMALGFSLNVWRQEMKTVLYRRTDSSEIRFVTEAHPYDAYERGGHRWEVKYIDEGINK